VGDGHEIRHDIALPLAASSMIRQPRGPARSPQVTMAGLPQSFKLDAMLLEKD
jgi:hypothetical protein